MLLLLDMLRRARPSVSAGAPQCGVVHEDAGRWMGRGRADREWERLSWTGSPGEPSFC